MDTKVAKKRVEKLKSGSFLARLEIKTEVTFQVTTDGCISLRQQNLPRTT